MDENLGNYLRKLRGDLSLREVSKRTNGKISHNYIRDSEKGVTTRGNVFVPSIEKLKIFSDVYNVSLDTLLQKAGYVEHAEQEKIELDRLLNEEVPMTYGGEDLTKEEKEQVKNIVRGLFLNKLNKRSDGND